jgi:sigma-B regulation protein RsbU (phosphoserine phosphatase)
MRGQSGLIRTLTSPPMRVVRRLLKRRAKSPVRLADPLHSDVPALQRAEIAAVYRGERVAGDFYEFLRVSPSRVLFGLLDIAGRRRGTREILIAAQQTLRAAGAELFGEDDLNEPESMIELCHRLNRTILQAAGEVRSCPAFLGCYNEDLGTICYANAGHMPALLRDHAGISQLEATGLPFGLFSHTTHSASTCALVPGAVLLVVSRGIVEAESRGGEFGLGGVKNSLQQALAHTARNLWLAVLRSVEQFTEAVPCENDLTALALLRGPSMTKGRS